ncbi:PREDICTED: F-box/WD repeat-containing protein 5-like isoform X1 [Branchiostoma belcheri]|uniref:F-box/WD repeat-containing protein 5-like isoform X1 n=1 Tax=Branchiostoma belcheri TaxID=7741 RepID=A0A6P5AJT3_BRABE|nr:PREDICTED: F-box/WD repeat-containing protein 5-like isoform X1 [Branchiostoma belcheri]XP_019643357.1 PREDICTED: F-box/WD repeat-containing protein 5-like isoform X1 [Branchiostoma belcheri]
MPNTMMTWPPAEVDLWLSLPDSILLHVFSFLNSKEVAKAGITSKKWHRVSQDDLLWKDLLYSEFSVSRTIPMAPLKTSWRSEFRRLHFLSPVALTETLKEHTDQVLHVSFSHNGKMFASSSKDGFIKVWTVSWPCQVKYSADMKKHKWKYTQFSQFNSLDTLLLVSGVHFGPHSTSGEIAVFSLQDEFMLQARVLNKPYDIFGTWLDDSYLLSGNLHWLGDSTCSVLWLNKATQEVDSEQVSVVMRLFRFRNFNSSTIRMVTVADCSRFLTDADPTVNTHWPVTGACQPISEEETSSGSAEAVNAGAGQSEESAIRHQCGTSDGDMGAGCTCGGGVSNTDFVGDVATLSKGSGDGTAAESDTDLTDSKDDSVIPLTKKQSNLNLATSTTSQEQSHDAMQDDDTRDGGENVGPHVWEQYRAAETSHGATAEPSHESSAGSSHDATAGPAHDTTVEPSHDSTAGPSHDATAGPSHDATAGPSHDATAGPSHDATAAGPSHESTARSSSTSHDSFAMGPDDLFYNYYYDEESDEMWVDYDYLPHQELLPRASYYTSPQKDSPTQRGKEGGRSQNSFSSGASHSGEHSELLASYDNIDVAYRDHGGRPSASDKYLIFTTGSETYTPHQIGIKRIRPQQKVMKDPKTLLQENALHGFHGMDGQDLVEFDSVDQIIELHGHIIGMGLSPDHRYLFVNSRSWPEGYTIREPLEPPPIAEQIEMHVFDLTTMSRVDRIYTSHKAKTPNDECFFIFLDVANEFVASGAEDHNGYIWDRHYNTLLAKLPHTDVVNSVAFNPQDPEMLITASDDFTLKVWRSRRKQHEHNEKQDTLKTPN